VSHVAKLMLMWALSPIGTLLNTGLLAVAMLLGGAGPNHVAFWLALALFLSVSAYLDARAYLVQRRKGLTAYQVAEAVFERIWPPREGEK
jgi:hypothetical protein